MKIVDVSQLAKPSEVRRISVFNRSEYKMLWRNNPVDDR